MRLPVILNSNFQIQDADGVVVCEMWRNPRAVEEGGRIVELLNGEVSKVNELNGLTERQREDAKALLEGVPKKRGRPRKEG